MRKVLTLVAIVALSAAGCQGDDGGGNGQATRRDDRRPTRGGSLVVALPSDPGHLNPAITTSGAVHAAAELLYNGLLSRDADGRPVGDLAERWDVQEDGAVYRFTLHDGVRWHDGRPFTADDVKFTFEKVLLQLHARTKASMGSALAGIDAPDARTVVFRFKGPYGPLLEQLDVTEAPILPKHLFENTDPNTNPANTSPVGTGPFKFVSYNKGSEIRLARYGEYHKRELPYLDEVVLRVIPDPATQLLALENGEVDWISGVPGPEQARVRDNDAIETERTAWNPGGSNCIMTIAFNLDRPALKERRVREAFFSALDRQQFLDQVLFGEGAVASAPISSGIAWAHADEVALPRFDRGRAERLLDEAGWKRSGTGVREARGVSGVPDGTRLAVDFVHFPTFAKYGELVRQQLSEVGVEITQKPLEPAAFPTPVFRDRNFDTAIISYCNGPDPEIGVRRMYHSSQIGPAPFTNAAGYRNPRVDNLFDSASREVDREERGRIYAEIQEIVAQDLPYAWVVETLATRAYDARCEGFAFNHGLFAEAAHCKG